MIRGRIIIDPGIGFGKTLEHNLEIIAGLPLLADLGCPIAIGPSRKSFIGAILDKPPRDRLWGTAAAVAASIIGGAHIVRVHDVGEMKDVAAVMDQIINQRWTSNVQRPTPQSGVNFEFIRQWRTSNEKRRKEIVHGISPIKFCDKGAEF